MLGVLLALAALFAVARLAVVPRLSSTSAAAGALETGGARALADCPGTPNCVGSEASDPARRVERLRVPDGDGTALDAVARWIGSQPGATIVSRDADYLHATFRTPLMGYTDDVEFLAAPDGGLAVRSASRLGRSDLGANRKRVERIRAALAG